MTASSNISPVFSRKKTKDNFVKIEFEVHNLTKITGCQLLWSILDILADLAMT